LFVASGGRSPVVFPACIARHSAPFCAVASASDLSPPTHIHIHHNLPPTITNHPTEWIKEHDGLCTEEDYPYTAEAGFCRKRTCQAVPGSHVLEWVDVHPSEQAMMKALNVGPVSVAIEADQRQFQLYAEGVFTGACGTNLDHGVLAVGYGTSADGVAFWKVKNSWGETWGQGGYIYLQRGVQQYGGQCGILLAGSYISKLE
jgi:hypothetical protein